MVLTDLIKGGTVAQAVPSFIYKRIFSSHKFKYEVEYRLLLSFLQGREAGKICLPI